MVDFILLWLFSLVNQSFGGRKEVPFGKECLKRRNNVQSSKTKSLSCDLNFSSAGLLHRVNRKEVPSGRKGLKLKGQSEALVEKIILIGIIILAALLIYYAISSIGQKSIIGGSQTDPRTLIQGFT